MVTKAGGGLPRGEVAPPHHELLPGEADDSGVGARGWAGPAAPKLHQTALQLRLPPCKRERLERVPCQFHPLQRTGTRHTGVIKILISKTSHETWNRIGFINFSKDVIVTPTA